MKIPTSKQECRKKSMVHFYLIDFYSSPNDIGVFICACYSFTQQQ